MLNYFYLRHCFTTLFGFIKWSFQARFPIYKIGDFIENCGCKPCLVTNVNYLGGEIDFIDITHSHSGGCSIINCLPRKITPNEAVSRYFIYQEDGERGLLMASGYSPAEADDFIKNYR